jgi:site-specific recombinase XerD
MSDGFDSPRDGSLTTGPWEAWVERYKAHLELEGRSRRTVASRAWLLSKFVAWAKELGVEGPSAATVGIMADYKRYRVERVNDLGRRDRAVTVNSHLLAMRTFLRLIAARGAAPSALLEPLRAVKEPRLLPKETLNHAEVMRLLERIPGDSAIHLRDRALIELLYSTALRRQEAVDLKVEDVDLDGGVVRVVCGKGAKGRVTPIGRAAVEWVRKYLVAGRPSLLKRAEDPGNLFLSKSGRRLDGTDVRGLVSRWAKAAGIAKAVSPHMLRRSCATGMIRNRANPAHVKDLLGQEDWESLSAYVKLEIVDLKDAHRRFHPRERGDHEGGGGA